jgi:hypothetical protein|tara:strand:- start:157 stop:324 length:168 start_codon:yes stop_codon:yes gene_type:complete
MDLTKDEIIDLIDCVNNRIDDLHTCAMYGDGVSIADQIERMETLIAKLESEVDNV